MNGVAERSGMVSLFDHREAAAENRQKSGRNGNQEGRGLRGFWSRRRTRVASHFY